MGLDTVELVIAFEDAFGIKIPDEVATGITTPREVTDYVLMQLKFANKDWTREQVAARVREVVIEQTGTEDFTEDSRFIQDLHMD